MFVPVRRGGAGGEVKIFPAGWFVPVRRGGAGER